MPLVNDSVLVEQSPAWHLHQMHGACLTGHRPILVVVLTSAENNVGVYDASTGEVLNSFTGLSHVYSEPLVRTHVYESDGRLVLVAAPDGDPIRQWDVLTGEPVHEAIVVSRPSRALTSYSDNGRTVLVVVDDDAVLRRFGAAGGNPVGEPVRLPPERITTERSHAGRLFGRLRRDAPGISWEATRNITWDPLAPEPTVLVAGHRVVWRVAVGSGAVSWIHPQPPLLVRSVLADPRPEVRSLIMAGEKELVAWDARLDQPVGSPYKFVHGYPERVAVAGTGDGVRVFTGLGARVMSWVGGSETPPEAILDPEEVPENVWIEDLCVLPVDGRPALFACDGDFIYRYDAVTLAPWPANPAGTSDRG